MCPATNLLFEAFASVSGIDGLALLPRHRILDFSKHLGRELTVQTY